MCFLIVSAKLHVAQLCCVAPLITNTPQAMHTEAADAGSTDAVGDSARAKPASPINTITDEQPDRPHHVAAVPGMGVNPVASVPDQVGIDVTLSPFLSAELPPDVHRLSHCPVSYRY
jgi:hypothetical protein